ncbi:MAG: branched-chain amino acid ABC transporter permease [Rhodobacteraceae bacterium]|nr:branched-chain amino acid ABC transporter permease [Paracoccaceae bacterium]
MNQSLRAPFMFLAITALIVGTGMVQGWNLALAILNMGLISAVMALGVNLQWGFAGLFNIGVMGFVALGGLASVLVAMPPTEGAWDAGGPRIFAGLALGAATVALAIYVNKRMPKGLRRGLVLFGIIVVGFTLYRMVFAPGAEAVEDINPALYGNLGRLGLPVLLSWPVGGLFAAGGAWVIGKTALGLRSDYLAIATLGIAEIIVAPLKNEDWLARGVKNIIGIPRPVPFEIDLQASQTFVDRAASLGFNPVLASTLTVKLAYGLLFTVVLVVLLWFVQKALNSPWGRMMRAIRDNEDAAEAMGKDVTARHLQIFILGSAICGLAGAMMTTLDGQLTPGSYQPLRFTFLIWVMVIVGGSGNNYGSVIGGILIWWLWVMVEPIGLWLITTGTSAMADDYWLKIHLLESSAHMRMLTMGLILLLVLRFSPRGLLPET